MTSFRIALVTLSLLAAPYFLAEHTRLRPGFNVFSAQQDVEIGKEVWKDAERNLRILNDSQINSYTNSLGRRLASRAPGEKYPYQFKIVDDKQIKPWFSSSKKSSPPAVLGAPNFFPVIPIRAIVSKASTRKSGSLVALAATGMIPPISSEPGGP